MEQEPSKGNGKGIAMRACLFGVYELVECGWQLIRSFQSEGEARKWLREEARYNAAKLMVKAL